MTIAFTIMGVPVAKGRPRAAIRGKFAHFYTPKATRDAEATLVARAYKYAPDAPMRGPLRVNATFTFAYPKSMPQKARPLAQHVTKPDIDNLWKLLIDALAGVFFVDDKQIVATTIAKRYGNDSRVDVRITDEEIPF